MPARRRGHEVKRLAPGRSGPVLDRKNQAAQSAPPEISLTRRVSAFTVVVICSVISRACSRRIARTDAANTANKNRRPASPNAVFGSAYRMRVTDHVPRAATYEANGRSKPLSILERSREICTCDDIGLRIEMIVPDVFQQHGSRHHLPRMLH